MAQDKSLIYLANWLRWPQNDCELWVQGMPNGYAYSTFKIPKRDRRRFRQIDAPNDSLRNLQKRIYHQLLKNLRPHLAATGFVPRQSIVDNAKPHVGKAVVINLDLKV